MELSDPKLAKSRLSVSVAAPFFGIIMFRETKLSLVKGFPTAATDGRRIIFGEEFFDSLSLKEQVFVICHEVYHVVARHAQKMQHYSKVGLYNRPFYPALYNWCADAIINRGLIESGIGQMPTVKEGEHAGKPYGVLHDSVSSNDLTEEVYKRFLDTIPESNDEAQRVLLQQAGGDGEDGEDGGGGGGQDTAAGGTAKAYGFSGVGGDKLLAPAPDAPSEQEVNAAVAQAAAQASKTQGRIPAGLKRMLDEILEPTIPWAEELRTEIVARGGTDTVTWSKPRKRTLFFPGVYMPRRTGYRTGHIVVGIDTSGSMSDHEISAILGELAGILTDCRPETCHVVWCDSYVERVDEVTEAGELAELVRSHGAPGGGGTSFRPVFEWVEQNLEVPPATLVYGTDMICDFPEDPGYPVIWCSTTPGKVAPWGKTVTVDLK